MANIKDVQRNTFGSIAAIQTIVENYPSLKNSDSLPDSMDLGTSLGFLMGILRIFGINETEIVNWLANLLTGDDFLNEDGTEKEYTDNDANNHGLLNVIEYAIKGILFANIKDMFGGCPVSPIIPDYLFENMPGIDVKLSLIDMFGVLRNCPRDPDGSVYYFDVAPNIYNGTYSQNELWQSSDFNAFLWYVINKGGNVYWDNRVNCEKELLSKYDLSGDTIYYPFRDAFYGQYDNGVITVDGKDIYKKNIIKCVYKDTGNITDGDGVINVTLPSSTYTYDIGNNFYINRTIFEFNKDYIFGLKLLHPKVVLANCINALFGLAGTIEVGYSIQKKMVQEQVSQMVENIMREESDSDNTTIDCAAAFSNRQYDKMLKHAEDMRTGTYRLGDSEVELTDEDKEVIINKLTLIKENSQQTDAIIDAINTTANICSSRANVEVTSKLSFNANFLIDFVKTCITEIVMQVMSPKVMMLYTINTAIMGDVTNIDEWEKNFKFSSPTDFFKKFNNLIETIVIEVIDILIRQLFNFVMSKITPIIELFTKEILLETIKDYKDLITQLITTCGMLGINIARYGNTELAIDNVNYADIVPTQTTPRSVDC